VIAHMKLIGWKPNKTLSNMEQMMAAQMQGQI